MGLKDADDAVAARRVISDLIRLCTDRLRLQEVILSECACIAAMAATTFLALSIPTFISAKAMHRLHSYAGNLIKYSLYLICDPMITFHGQYAGEYI